MQLLAFFSVFALLVSNTAACLASRLAGSLAFAASAILSAVTKVAGFDCFDMFHNLLPPHKIALVYSTINSH